MDELIKTFHIDWKLLIAQIVNFVIVLSVLYYFASKPLLTLMHDRSKKIEDGIKNAEIIEKNLTESEKQKQAAINSGRKEAQTIISQAEKEAEAIHQEKVSQAKVASDKIVVSAKQEIRNERQQMLRELKSELGELVLLASKKISGRTIDAKQHKVLIGQVIEDLKKSEIE